MWQTSIYDAVIVGAGHNGLVCACYLAKAGLKVRVLERRSVIGGAAVTEEFYPGFRNSTASYAVSLLNPKVIQDLHLTENGLRIVERSVSNFLPLPDGNHIEFGGNQAETQAQIARFSSKDAARLPEYSQMLDRVADTLKKLILQTPPNVGGGFIDWIRGFRLGKLLKQLSMSERRDFLDIMGKSAGDLLNGWFESDPIKGFLGFDSITGNFVSPYAAGSAYLLLHHAIGGVNGKKRVWGHAIGGMGAITQAMAKEAMKHGVQISVDSAVKNINIINKKAVGVTLENGDEIAAKRVVSNLSPKLLYLHLIDKTHLEPEFLHRMQLYKCGSATFRMNVALSELPKFTCKAKPGGHYQSGIIFSPSLAYIEKAYFDARTEGFSKEPVIEMLIPSTIDDSLAPNGQHVASLFCQHFSPKLPSGQSWHEVKDKAADQIIDTVTRYAPNFKSSILGRMVLSPTDLEARFGLVDGDIFHGALTINQLLSARPILGYANYRTPIERLYTCGSGNHPGGGVSGAPGHNAAFEILRDKRKLRYS